MFRGGMLIRLLLSVAQAVAIMQDPSASVISKDIAAATAVSSATTKKTAKERENCNDLHSCLHLQPAGNLMRRLLVASMNTGRAEKERDAIVSDMNSITLDRELGDFDELNQIFAETILQLPKMTFKAGTFFFTDFYFTAKRTVCTDLSLQNLILRHSNVDTFGTQIRFELELQGLAFDCEIEWDYDWGFTGGSGDGQIYSSGNNFNMDIIFTSDNFSTSPPTKAELSSCSADMQIDDIDLQGGGFIPWLINAVEGALRSPIEDAVNQVICEEADAIADELIDLMTTLDHFLEPYEIDLPEELGDPLFPEKNNLKSGVELLAFDDSAIFKLVLTLIDDMLGGIAEDPTSPNGTGMDLGVNKIIRSAILDEDRMLVIDGGTLPNDGIVLDSEDMLSQSTVQVERIVFKGLDTMTRFDPLSPYPGGNYTLENSFGFDFIDVEIDLLVTIRPTKLEENIFVGEKVVTEHISIDFGVDDINVDFAVLLGIDMSKVGDLPLGAILKDFDKVVSCAMEFIHVAEIGMLSTSVGNLEAPQLNGFISPGIDRVISSGADAIFAMYKGAIIEVMPNIFQLGFRKSINEMLSNVIQDSKGCAWDNFDNSTSTFVNFADLFLQNEDAVTLGGFGNDPYGGLLKSAYTAIEGGAMDLSGGGPSFLNEYIIHPLTYAQSGIEGNLLFPGPIFDMESDITIGELRASLKINISDLTLESIDTLGLPLTFLRPLSAHVLDNMFTLGFSEQPFVISFKLKFAFEKGVDIIQNDLVINMEFSNMLLHLNAFVAMVEKAFMTFPLGDITNLDCWLATIPPPTLDIFGMATSDSSRSVYIEDLGMTTSVIELDVKCVECTSPELENLTNLLSSEEAINDLTDAMNDVSSWIVSIAGGNLAQIQIDRLLVSSQMKCPHSSSFATGYQKVEYEQIEHTTSNTLDVFLIPFVAAIMAVVFFSSLAIFTIRLITRRKNTAWSNSLTIENRHALAKKAIREERRQRTMDAETTSIFRSSSIPVIARFSLPCMIICNILLFLSGHISLGAGVHVNLDVAGQNLPLGAVLEFSLGKSILDMWEAGATELAVIVAIFSGVWPYTKQLITLFLWFSPTRWVSVLKRGSILSWLDALGKWSFIDIFVLVITLVAFRLSVKSPDDFSFLPLNFYAMELLVIPGWGLYANMIAQILSQISSHFVIHFHRKIIFHHRLDENEFLDCHPSSEKRKLCDHIFDKEGVKHGNGLKVKRGVGTALILLSLVVSAGLCCGCVFDILKFENFGFIGILVETGQDFEEASNAYSVFTMVKVMMEQARYTEATADYIGLGVLAFLFVATVLLVPLAQMFLLLQRYFCPLDRTRRNTNFTAVEILSSWQYSEVFILSVVITSWQLAPVSEFFVNDSCEGLTSTFDSLVTYGIIDKSDGQCFRAEPSVKVATWFLTVAALGLALLNHFVGNAAMHQKEDELALYRDRIHIKTDSLDLSDATLQDYLIIPSAKFTEYYRWILRSNFERTSSLSSSITGGNSSSSCVSIGSIDFEQTSSTNENSSSSCVSIGSIESDSSSCLSIANKSTSSSIHDDSSSCLSVEGESLSGLSFDDFSNIHRAEKKVTNKLLPKIAE
jgi:hypothetical protein